MKTKTLTYEVAAKEIEALSLSGEKITVRNVLARTGGSAGTIGEFIKQWQNQQRVMKAYTLSDNIISTLLAEIETAVNEALKAKELELADSNLINEELKAVNHDLGVKLLDYSDTKQQLLSSQERCSLLEQELNSARKAYADMVGESAVLSKSLEYLNNKVAKFEEQLQRVENEKHKALEDVTIHKVRAEQLQQQFDKLCGQLEIKPQSIAPDEIK